MAMIRVLLVPLLALPLAAGGGDSVSAYGAGSAGTGGKVPALWARTTPRPGTPSFGFLVEDGRANASAIGMIAANSANLNLGGLSVLVDPAFLIALPAVTLGNDGSGAINLPIPNLPGLITANLYAQVVVLDNAGPLGLASSNGLRFLCQLPGVLLVPRSVGGSPDPQMLVDLASGAISDFSSNQIDNGEMVAFTKGNTHALMCGALSRNVAAYDLRTLPPTFVRGYAITGQGSPYVVSITPDGERCYVLSQGSSTQTPIGEVLRANPAHAQFAQAYPGATLPLPTRDCIDMVFSADGKTGYIGALGLFSGGGAIYRVDTDPQSATYHQVTGTIQFPGEYLWSLVISPNGLWLYAAVSPLTLGAKVAVVFAPPFLLRDMDPGAPGVQLLGEETSIPRTVIERQVTNLRADQRGRYLYLANFNSVTQLVIDQGRTDFRSVVTVTAGIPNGAFSDGLALTDAGDRLYVGLHSGGVVVEYDTSNMSPLRTFPVGANPTEMTLR